MKKLLGFFVILFWAMVSLSRVSAAQNGSELELNCEKPIETAAAQELLARAQTNYAALHGFRASFIQRSYLAALDQAELSTGEVSYLKGGFMRWDYKTPTEQLFVVRDGVLYFYQPDLKQLIIDRFNRVLISDLPVAFIMGVGDLNHEFRVLSACDSRLGVIFDLTRRAKSDDASDQLKSFRLVINPNSALPKGAQIFDLGGNSTEIVFQNMEANPRGLSEETFKPEFPSGIDVDDRRKGEHDGANLPN